MIDWTGITAVIAPITTLLGVLGGYGLAGRNEESRDQRAAQREGQARLAALAERLEEDRNAFQRDTLLELQNELQRLVRNAAQEIMQDRKTIKESGHLDPLSGDLSDQGLQITVSVQRLRARVIDDELRDAIGKFVDTCPVGGIELRGYPDDKVPDNEREAAIALLDRRMWDMIQAYNRLTDFLGTHLRRELDRRYLLSGPRDERPKPPSEREAPVSERDTYTKTRSEQ